MIAVKLHKKIFIKGATSTLKGKIRDKSRNLSPNKVTKPQQTNQQRYPDPQEGHL